MEVFRVTTSSIDNNSAALHLPCQGSTTEAAGSCAELVNRR
jgi:hypothetical protein